VAGSPKVVAQGVFSVSGTATTAGAAQTIGRGAASVAGTTTVIAVGFRSFRFDATLYERDRVAFVAQEPAREVAVGKPTQHVLYVVQDTQRVVLIPEDKPRTVSIPQAVQRLAKVA